MFNASEAKDLSKERVHSTNENEMKLEIKSKSCNVAFARATVIAFISQLNPSLDELADINTVVSEAVKNSIIHGYENNDGVIHINCSFNDKTIWIEIIDYGKGIENLKIAMAPYYTSKYELGCAGMGFTVMQCFVDELKVESTLGSGTKVFMKKMIR